ncbi:MAG: hypothetical protein M3Q53_01145 [Actinomycetota bacterium]|nr:hypothetical protein [Actinomycetota bacterium]
MARALIVGCGCRGRELGAFLQSDGWSVRGTSRSSAGVDAIVAAGLEGVAADPDRLDTVLDHIGDIAVIAWLMGSASGEPASAVNGERLESLMIRLVDTPVRGFVYEAAGSAPAAELRRGTSIVEAAAERWRIPVALLRAEPRESGWNVAAADAVSSVIGS